MWCDKFNAEINKRYKHPKEENKRVFGIYKDRVHDKAVNYVSNINNNVRSQLIKFDTDRDFIYGDRRRR